MLTYSMEQRPPWEADSRLVGSWIPSPLWNQKLHYSANKIPLLGGIFRQFNPLHTHAP
jgi:hypothetical protein